ncbi:fenitrothion hydrolase [Paraconexibacter algicola]|uniref:Fenitrothion hydrolase n=1 Tax=Paraconexibacter algicola TaxID=2133960 RepID=A0A2T4UMQ0_9ACTN|nr:fenitrothion hydrolase [Paraconexibacter algicola]PTL60481.1 fenitrothion hydrolase [Paraconexibacter algicola]
MCRRRAALGAGLLAAVLLPATPAVAHGIDAAPDLPVPSWLFGWAAAIVLVVSFVWLGTAWRTPRLRPAGPDAPGADRAPDAADPVPLAVQIPVGALAVVLWLATMWAGWSGTEVPEANLAPTLVFVVFWVGVAVASILFGDVWSTLSPFRALGRGVGALTRRLGVEGPPAVDYPQRLGAWPAALGVLAFAWLELVASSGDRPANIATATAIYSGVTFVGMAVYGVETWHRRAEAFSVLFGLLARIRRRPVLRGLGGYDATPGITAVVLVAIGTTTYDGLSGGSIYADTAPDVTRWLVRRGLSSDFSYTVYAAALIVVCIALISGLYWLACRSAERTRGWPAGRSAWDAFSPSLVPIAAAYLVAHYLSLLLINGQRLPALLSDPRGAGTDYFGTAGWTADPGVLPPERNWYVQVAILIAGHVAAIVLAHDRALELFGGDHRAAARSQQVMLVVMVGFTALGLWLLSSL